MDIKDVKFIGSFDKEHTCPERKMPEYAFIGRSNVGKSSLINMITNRKAIAKVSKIPGKTQLINFFEVNEEWHLVDLPGYGYAKISKKKRAQWEKMIESYLVLRKTLVCAFVLIDSRLKLQPIDLEFINWLGENSVPFAIVFTKTDKLNKSEIEGNIKLIKDEILESWEELPKDFITSSEKGWGRDELLGYIEEINKNFYL